MIKFGLTTQDGLINKDEKINKDILQTNLNDQLFLEVYENAFATLQIAFNYFKKTELF